MPKSEPEDRVKILADDLYERIGGYGRTAGVAGHEVTVHRDLKGPTRPAERRTISVQIRWKDGRSFSRLITDTKAESVRYPSVIADAVLRDAGLVAPPPPKAFTPAPTPGRSRGDD